MNRWTEVWRSSSGYALLVGQTRHCARCLVNNVTQSAVIRDGSSAFGHRRSSCTNTAEASCRGAPPLQPLQQQQWHMRQLLLGSRSRRLPSACGWQQARHCSRATTAAAATAAAPAAVPAPSAADPSCRKPFEELWNEARRVPQRYEQLNRDEAQFIRDFIVSLPRYEPYAVVRPDRLRQPSNGPAAVPASAAAARAATLAIGSTPAASPAGQPNVRLAAEETVIAQLERFGRGGVTWAEAFRCLDGIGRLSSAAQQSLLMAGSCASPDFTRLIAFCCANLRVLSADDYRKLMRSLAGVSWEHLAGKTGLPFVRSAEYRELAQRVTQACSALRPQQQPSPRRKQPSLPQSPLLLPPTGAISPMYAKFHMAYELMAEHARRMPSWGLADVFYFTDVFNTMFLASNDPLLRSYYVAMMAVVESLLVVDGGSGHGSSAAAAAPAALAASGSGGTAPAAAAAHTPLVMVCYAAACSRYAPRSLMRHVEMGVRQRWAALQPLERAVVALGYFKSQNKFTSRQLICGMLDTARVVSTAAGAAGQLPPACDASYVVSSLIKQCAYSVDRMQVAIHDGVRATMLRCYAAVAPASPLATAVRCLQSMVVMRQVVWPTVEWFVSALSAGSSSSSVGTGASVYDDYGDRRMKDLAVVLFVLGSLQCRAAGSDALYRQLLADLTSAERVPELHSHPRRTLTALLGLAYLGVYPASVYDWVLRQDFLDFVQRHLAPEDLAVLRFLNGSIALDMPSYDGPRLMEAEGAPGIGRNASLSQPSEHSVLGKESPEESSRRLQALKNVEDVLLDVLPSSYDTRITQLLPLYSTADIEVTLVDSPPPQSATRKLALVLCTDCEYFKVYDDLSGQKPPRKLLSGRCAMKLRHVAAAGYAVAPVAQHEFDASKDKKAYIKHIVASILV